MKRIAIDFSAAERLKVNWSGNEGAERKVIDVDSEKWTGRDYKVWLHIKTTEKKCLLQVRIGEKWSGKEPDKNMFWPYFIF